jgi:putative hemolysin
LSSLQSRALLGDLHSQRHSSRKEAIILFELFIITLLAILNGLFAGAELAILSLRKTRIKELLEEGHNSAKAILALRDQPERFLATVQIGITIISATAGAFGGASLALRLTPILQELGLEKYASVISFVLAIGLVSYLSLILGELVPKSLALKFTEGYAMFISRPLLWLSWLMRPLVWLLTASSNLILRFFHDETNFSESRLSPEELRQLVEEAALSGTLDPHASEIASRAFEFGELTVAKLAIPRAKIDAIPLDATHDELRAIVLAKTHSRFPVYKETIDDIVGYVTIKELLSILYGSAGGSLQSILREVYFAPSISLATRVLRELQRRRTQLAIVIDEHGSLFGLVTAENLIEELVGDVSDEHETPKELIHKNLDGSYTIMGAAPLRTVNRALEIELEESDGHTTLGGLCITLAGLIPQKGVQLIAPEGTRLEILDAAPQRVNLVRVYPAPKPTEEKL